MGKKRHGTRGCGGGLRTPWIRSSQVDEPLTVPEATVVQHERLVKKLEKCPAPVVSATGLRPPHRSKRQRASDGDSVFVRQLMCIPSVSEGIATRLVQHFGDLESLQAALRDVRSFPRIQIGNKTFLGKARIATLAKHLVSTGVTK